MLYESDVCSEFILILHIPQPYSAPDVIAGSPLNCAVMAPVVAGQASSYLFPALLLGQNSRDPLR